MIRRFLYAMGVVVTLPLFFLIGAFLDEDHELGWFRSSGIGLFYSGFVLLFPVLLLASAMRWITTGRGFV